MKTIDGVHIVEQRRHADARGAFTELFSDHWDLPIVPSQWSLVESGANALRGMHVHARHDELIRVIAGRAIVGLLDIRPNSPTCDVTQIVELSASAPSALVFPAGLMHGWYFPEPTTHVQAVSESYAFYNEDDNNGCRWNDPDLGIDWPCTDPIVSDRHMQFGPLSELRVRIAAALST